MKIRGEKLMKSYSATINISASPGTVWKVLIDGDKYPDWDPGMDRVEGTIALGEQVKFFTKMSPDRAFPAKVTTFEPGQKMVLTGGMPLGLFKSVRTHTLTPNANGDTTFETKEIFSGLLLPLFGRNIPDLTQVFENFATGLKTQSEKG
jgi:uncharacterized protein YndB with AHSA1/START domain